MRQALGAAAAETPTGRSLPLTSPCLLHLGTCSSLFPAQIPGGEKAHVEVLTVTVCVLAGRGGGHGFRETSTLPVEARVSGLLDRYTSVKGQPPAPRAGPESCG